MSVGRRSTRREEDSERSPLASGWFAAAAGLLALVAAGGVWLVVDSGSHPTPAASTAATSSTRATAGAGDSVCGLPAGDQTVPNAPLGADQITVGDGLTVPTVDGVGPGVTDGITHCFAHSPRGAVVAAVNFTRWLSTNQQLPEVTRTLVQAGADRDLLLADVEDNWSGRTTQPLFVEGYRLSVRSQDQVIVDVAMSNPSDGSLVSWSLVMVWDEGDWKVQPPANGAWGWAPVAGTLADAGFIPWPVG